MLGYCHVRDSTAMSCEFCSGDVMFTRIALQNTPLWLSAFPKSLLPNEVQWHLSFVVAVIILLLYLDFREKKNNSSHLSAGITFGAACTLSSVEEVLRKAVAELPSYKTEIFQAALQQLRWFAGPQIRNVAVSDSGILGTGTESLV